MNLSDAKALVTGGGSGLGREFVLQLARAGAAAAFCDVSEEGIAGTEAEARGLPG